ncbi:MAG TPA: hypothetical protein VFO41_13725 [Alphaproteobacteria bacterium]|nr:hypothetical protein [Alphaproteobacteria bacterium]
MDLVPVIATLGLMALVCLLMSVLILYAMRSSRPAATNRARHERARPGTRRSAGRRSR